MSDYDRGRQAGAAEPPLAFDDRRPQRRGGPAPITLILSILLLVAAGGGLFYIYRGGVRGSGDAPRPVGAPVGDFKTAAPPQIQAPDPATGLSIYKDDPNAASAAPAFVPPPEQPTPRPAPVAATAPPAPAPVASTPPAPTQSAKPVKQTSVAAAKSAAVKPAPPKSASTESPAKPTSITSLLADEGPPAAPKSGPAVVQIGAFSSKNLADAGWNDAAGVAPGVMAGKGKRIAPLTKADGSILYRTSITGFASRDEAAALCAKLKAAGQSCFVR